MTATDLGQWTVPTYEDSERLLLDEDVRGPSEAGQAGRTKEVVDALYDFYTSREANGVVHTTLAELGAAIGATRDSTVVEVLAAHATAKWWDIEVRFQDGAVRVRLLHHRGQRRRLFGGQQTATDA